MGDDQTAELEVIEHSELRGTECQVGAQKIYTARYKMAIMLDESVHNCVARFYRPFSTIFILNWIRLDLIGQIFIRKCAAFWQIYPDGQMG